MNDSEPQHSDTQSVATIPDSKLELDAFNNIVSAIQNLPDREAQIRVVKSALTFLGWTDLLPQRTEQVSIQASSPSSFSEDRNLTPKEFLLEKKPITDIERVTCLAYYQAHYRDITYFKTLDISKLNTEAAQVKLSNAAAAVENATAAGFLVSAGRGNKQISAIGELYVQALPDREAARAAVAHVKPRRKSKKAVAQDNSDEDEQK
jgi:hypothetical protein